MTWVRFIIKIDLVLCFIWFIDGKMVHTAHVFEEKCVVDYWFLKLCVCFLVRSMSVSYQMTHFPPASHPFHFLLCSIRVSNALISLAISQLSSPIHLIRLARLFFQRIILHVKSYIVHVLYPVLLGQRVSRIVAKNQEHLLNCFKRYDFIFTALFITILFPCLFCAS